MTDRTATSSGSRHHDGPVALRCLDGHGAPPDLIADLRLVLGFPEAARQSFWLLLAPALVEVPHEARLEAHIDAYCKKHGLDGAGVVRAIKAYRFLLRHAAQHGSTADDLAADLARVGERHGEALQQIILPGFEPAVRELQQEIISGSVADHGKLLVGVDFRLDHMMLSGRGDPSEARVGLLTFRYREGERRSRITLQALPDVIAELQAICAKMLSAP